MYWQGRRTVRQHVLYHSIPSQSRCPSCAPVEGESLQYVPSPLAARASFPRMGVASGPRPPVSGRWRARARLGGRASVGWPRGNRSGGGDRDGEGDGDVVCRRCGACKQQCKFCGSLSFPARDKRATRPAGVTERSLKIVGRRETGRPLAINYVITVPSPLGSASDSCGAPSELYYNSIQ